jgi:hypothetical protein
MKRILLIICFITLCLNYVSAQYKVSPNKPYSSVNTKPGYITITELTGAYGLSKLHVPYSTYFWGFTSLHGYQVSKNFIGAAGAGLSVYNGGVLFPVFLDFRWRIYVGKYTPYIYADGGLLLNFSDLNCTKLFINPGLGLRYSFDDEVAATFSGGLLSQTGEWRDSFINFKTGIVYIPKRGRR